MQASQVKRHPKVLGIRGDKLGCIYNVQLALGWLLEVAPILFIQYQRGGHLLLNTDYRTLSKGTTQCG